MRFEKIGKKYKAHSSTRYVGETDRNLDKKLPELYTCREECCGCSACYSVCPVNAISMKPDEEGFLYPVVNISKCIRCYKCIGVCSFKIDQKEKL